MLTVILQNTETLFPEITLSPINTGMDRLGQLYENGV